MSSTKGTLELAKDYTKNQKAVNWLRGVTFAFCRLGKPSKKYQSEDKAWTIDVVVDKATSKAWKKAFPKNGIREVDTPDFENIYKVAPPFPDQDEQFVLKFAKDAYFKGDFKDKKTGEVIARKGDPLTFGQPKVIHVEGGIKKEVTNSKMVANGSFGDLAFNTKISDYGVFPEIYGIIMEGDNFIEFVMEGDSVFGDVVAEERAVEEPVQEQSEPETPVKETPKQESAPESSAEMDFDDDIPFSPVGLQHPQLLNCM